MDLASLVATIPGFFSTTGVEKIIVFVWYLQAVDGKDVVTKDDLRRCFGQIHAEPPDLSVYLPRMAAKKPAQLLKTKHGFRLDGALRRKLDSRYGPASRQVAVSSLLSGLLDKIPSVAERTFLRETLDCYKVAAYRAATVMAWNLAFDHFLSWIVNDTYRLSAFNQAIALKFPKKALVHVRTDFDEFKEYDLIEMSKSSKIITKNVAAVLSEKLKRRNMAAHPSNLIIEQFQADDTISDLVNNVVLMLQ